MAKITCGSLSYTVDHAVKGADYVHGYDADGHLVVSFEGVVDFSGIVYDGTYLTPEACFEEACNDVRHVGGKLVKPDGTAVGAAAIGAGIFGGQVVANASGQSPSTSLLRNSKLVNAETNPTVNGEIYWTFG